MGIGLKVPTGARRQLHTFSNMTKNLNEKLKLTFFKKIIVFKADGKVDPGERTSCYFYGEY